MRPTIVRYCFRAAALAIVAASAPLAGCRRAATREVPSATAPTTLRVDNRGFPDMVIYVVRSAGDRQRLGIATGSSTTTFTIPATVVYSGATLRFLADPIGGARAPVSQEISVQPGDQVELMIPPQ